MIEESGGNEKVRVLKDRIRNGIEIESCVNDLREMIQSQAAELAKAEVS